MDNRYDVVITGARVAGASLAVLLGKLGKKVLLIDKAPFPSDTLSTHYMSHTGYLEELGILDKLLAGGLRKVDRMRTHIGSSYIDGPRSAYTVIPKRDRLDMLLIERTFLYEGVTFLSETAVREVLWDQDRMVGVRIKGKGREKEVYGDLIVGADGKHSTIARQAGAEVYHDTPSLRPVLYGYFEGIPPLETPTTEIFLHEGRIGFLFPMEQGRDCIGLEVHPDEFKTMMKDSPEAFVRMYKQLYGMEKRLENARLQGSIIGTSGVPNFFRKPYGNGWALIGDAGHSKDPSTGLGINDAFMQAFLLADACMRIDAGDDREVVMEAFQKKRDEHLFPGFQLTLDYIHSLKRFSKNELALFQAMAANPMVWNKVAPKLGDYLREGTRDFPLLYHSVEMEAEAFGYDKDSSP
ncbi:UNVERIFIED_CONTAM: NAD(P)/FAD-dependent oxidoreductase [Halobacillus marinus]